MLRRGFDDDDEKPFSASSSTYDFPVKASAAHKGPILESDFVVLGLLPWLVFTLTICLFVYAFKDFEPLVWGLSASSLFLSLLLVVLAYSAQRPVQVSLGWFLFISVLAAVPIGVMIESQFMKEYWRIQSGASYRQVSAREPSHTFRDASVIEFDETATVDVNRSLGFKKGGSYFCVAPVYSGGKAFPSKPQFWAAGMDCCDARRGFTCAEAGISTAKTGLVIDDSPKLYMKAAKMAHSVYGLGPVEGSPIFMLWTEKPEKFVTYLWSSAMTLVTVAVSIHLMVASCVVYLYAHAVRQKE
eukprot:TRINITY_DN9399_c1_g2_i6.p1 TRINITY_DN9399_c1_g2~~TRINITY_DN9399_c1_g2_i6.p1  ORF type:complete len:300 (+),score=44.86 TRINITY_DN9399_c1_g2_i6:126-1025(+)